MAVRPACRTFFRFTKLRLTGCHFSNRIPGSQRATNLPERQIGHSGHRGKHHWNFYRIGTQLH
ncbi:hypothetical protein EVA_11487 [gut metagenome]|uniref:Uncharacterized protein n=1 Tax=gut metagenome TaxID=749906 RepID=J9CJY4_9ZZZZ